MRYLRVRLVGAESGMGVARGRGEGEGGGNREEPTKRYKVSGIRDEQFSAPITNNTVPYTWTFDKRVDLLLSAPLTTAPKKNWEQVPKHKLRMISHQLEDLRTWARRSSTGQLRTPRREPAPAWRHRVPSTPEQHRDPTHPIPGKSSHQFLSVRNQKP